MSSILTCPGCDNLVVPDSPGPAYLVHSCKNVLKYDGQIQLANLMAVPEFPELIQPGTTINWNNITYTVSGRVRIQLTESFINFWDLRSLNGDDYLLMEGYGLYAMLKEADQKFGNEFIQYGRKRDLGSNIKWEKDTFLLEEKDEIKDLHFEGEIRMPAAKLNGDFFSLSSPKGINYIIVEWTPNNPVTYQLTDTSFTELGMRNLREPQPGTKKFYCQSCNEALPVTLFPYVNSVVCKSCHMQHSYKHGNGFVKRKLIDYRLKATIPVGAEGTLKGIKFRVTGYTEKEETNSPNTFWREYTLYNPEEGFAFLSEYNGHWIYLRQKLDAPVLLDNRTDEFELDNESWIKYNSYWAKIRSAEGEFPNDVFNDSATEIKEFISPPEMWSREKEDDKAITWYFGESVSPAAIQQAFNVQEMPKKAGVGALQQTGYMSNYKMVVLWLVGLGILLLIHTVIMFSRQDRKLFHTDYVFMDTTSSQSIITPKFDLDKDLSNIEININSPVSNSWFELGATLVNTETGAEITQEKGVEFYSGISDGESWSEGSTKDEIWFNAVPKGTYMLQLQGVRPTTSDAVSSFSLDITYDVPSHRNFWFIALFWSVLIFLKALYQHQIEARRWDPGAFVSNNGQSLRYED